MKYVNYLNIYDVSSMLYAGELSQAAIGTNNYMGGSRTVSGIPIAGIRNILRNYMLDLTQQTAVLLVFDSKTDKQKLFPEYKSTRERNPKIYVQQLLLLDVVKKLGLPFLKVDTYEADDLIHTAVRHYSANAGTINLLSGDMDIAANLIRERISIRGTASIYPSFDCTGYSYNVKKGSVIPYNTILPYFLFFGKPSNNVSAFASSSRNQELFSMFLAYCDKEKVPEGRRSEIGVCAQWLLDALEDDTISAEDIQKLYARMQYVYPKEYKGEIPETFKTLEDINSTDLAFFLKLFNMDTIMQGLCPDELILAPKSPAMYEFVAKYKTIYQEGCLAVDNDMSPDDSFFSINDTSRTTVFNAEDF